MPMQYTMPNFYTIIIAGTKEFFQLFAKMMQYMTIE